MTAPRPIEDLLNSPPVWKTHAPPSPNIVQFSRIQVLRNLDTHLFTNQASPEELSDIRDQIQTAATAVVDFKTGWDLTNLKLAWDQEELLKDYAYIATGWRKSTWSGTLISSIRDAVVQVNTDDHLVLSVFRPGLAFVEALHRSEHLLGELSRYMMFARNGQVGYLTSNLCDAGPGIRVTVAMHLPALRMTGRIRPVIRGLEAIGFDVTNSTEDQGKMEDDIILITRNSSHGESAEQMAMVIEAHAQQVIDFETDCRQQLLEQTPDDLFDRVSRSYNILRAAYKLSSVDVQRFSSAIRLGIDCGMFTQLDHRIVDSVVAESSAFHLQHVAANPLKRRDIEIERAHIVKRALNLMR